MANQRKYDTAESRWAGIGPYYAMFPTDFADTVIEKYSSQNDTVLDPFAGRATSIYSAAVQNRIGIGIELNPVGWVYGKTKLAPAKQHEVEDRLEQLGSKAILYYHPASRLPIFFKHCFDSKVRRFLLAAREQLDWRRRRTDRTTMALLLVYLHGKREASLSNQMRQTKSMSPGYAVRWWKKRNLSPPEVDPVEFMRKRVIWRYARGTPETSKSQVYLGDCIDVMRRLRHPLNRHYRKYVRLLFTSPPYFGVTNYHYDQWLRLWLLGFSPVPYMNRGRHCGRFEHRDEYIHLLRRVFRKASLLLLNDAVVYVRTDGRDFTYRTTSRILKELFPEKKISEVVRPFQEPTQTHLFGDKAPKVGEVDLILEP